MKNNLSQKIHQIYKIILSISLIISALCLIFGCSYIYFFQEQTFTREIVIETLHKISFPLFVSFVLVILGIIPDFITPNSEKLSNKIPAYKPGKSLSNKASSVLRLSLLAIALIFIVLGVLQGGFVDVLTKAINICTECIGLG